MRKLSLALALVAALSATPVAAQDMLDLHAVATPSSPPVADWTQTVRITRVDIDPRGGVALTFDHSLPESWKFHPNPSVPDENFQFTVWACVEQVYCAGFIQMWQGRSMTDGSLPAILAGYGNWWGDARHLWGEMSDYRPQPGDTIGFLVSAGNARLTSDVSSVRERSNVVTVRLPAGDSGHFDFAAPAPTQPPVVVVQPPVQPPLPTVQICDLSAVRADIAALKVDVDQFHDEVRSELRKATAFVIKNVLPYLATFVIAKKVG